MNTLNLKNQETVHGQQHSLYLCTQCLLKRVLSRSSMLPLSMYLSNPILHIQPQKDLAGDLLKSSILERKT